MASIIKNQLIKHLSKFTRNLKPEQISVDVLRGNSKLKNIEINEEVLSDILELPSWLRIKKACCCGVTVNVPWTRLKTSPIQIFVDEIFVTVELVSGRAKRGENPFANMADNSSYGFANKVVENMSLFINSVEINFDSDEFGGSFTLSRLSVVSKSPGWQTANDLRLTRITCSATNRTLMYKQISWQLLRVEASAKTSKDEQRSKINAPLRLITSGGKIRVALKKSSIDGSVIHARIQTIMEDILWVATLPQLRSAIAFSSYIMSLVKEAQKEVVLVPTPAGASSHRPRSSEAPLSDSSSNAFKMFYFDQTSYHLHVNKIDLHLCDDANITNKYPPGWDIESGAMQVTLYRVLIDIYPKTLAKSDRSTWMHYQPANVFTQWMHKRLDDQFLELIKAIKDDTSRTRLERCWPQLMGFHVVVRIYDVIVQCVSDKNTKKDALKDLFVSERHARALPTDQYVVHFELASYFHPMTDTLPVPKLAMYLQMGPFSLTFDERTLRWCLYVAHNLGEAIEDGNLTPKIDTTAPKPDIRIDLLMPKLVFPLPTPTNDARLPLRLLISMSTLSISSCDFEASQRFHVQPFAGAVEALDFLHGKKEFMEHVAHIQLGSTPIESEKFFLRTSPVWIDTDHGNFTKGLPLINDVSFCGVMIADLKNLSVYVEATDEITLIIDHFQFLQVTRFASKIGEFFEILSADQKHFTGEKPSSGPCVFFLANIEKIRAHVFLTMGSMASPYDSCPAITDATTNSSFMERLSGEHTWNRERKNRSTNIVVR
ncbi:unnamed protein product [Caenorhabditis auriculariae]|uniref:Chorein N-terminal domain-containing protein n=1 Tax=Caenorhabditis auriculariae TaxID=2777116 RepID=A0A8S1GW10_9PELO|nr:unnamed protein product [Caenorhabditis auriculariae]